MDTHSVTMEQSKDTFTFNYFKALLISLPMLVSILINYFFFGRVSQGFEYDVFAFIVQIIISIATFSITLTVIRDQDVNIAEMFTPATKIIYFIIYNLIILGATYLFTEYFGSLSLDFVLALVDPFYNFIFSANSTFGFIIRLLISFDIIMMPFAFVGFLLVYRFFMVPFYIVDDEDLVSSLSNSWDNTSGSFVGILKTFSSLFWRFMVFINVYFIIAFLIILNGSSMETPFIIELALFMYLLLYFVPFSYIVIGTLYNDLK